MLRTVGTVSVPFYFHLRRSSRRCAFSIKRIASETADLFSMHMITRIGTIIDIDIKKTSTMEYIGTSFSLSLLWQGRNVWQLICNFKLKIEITKFYQSVTLQIDNLLNKYFKRWSFFRKCTIAMYMSGMSDLYHLNLCVCVLTNISYSNSPVRQRHRFWK